MLKKTLVLASTALGLILSAQAGAETVTFEDDNDANNITQVDDSGNTTVSDSGNTDNSVDDSGNVVDSGNTDNSTNDSGNTTISDSGNTDTDTDIDNSTNDSGNTTISDSGNTDTDVDNSTNDSGNTTISDSGNTWTKIDMTVAVATSELSGTVAGNSVDMVDMEDSYSHASNKLEGGAFAGATGITQVSQNAGANSLAQQSVVVQAHMSMSK
jgi:hypothetical protein